jgi:hypothetical protein
MDLGGWLILDVAGVALLAAALIYATMLWRRRRGPGTNPRARSIAAAADHPLACGPGATADAVLRFFPFERGGDELRERPVGRERHESA